MLLGDFESAWRESDHIEALGCPDPHRYWNGLPFAGKHVLIRCLHGLGDTIQYARYLPLIKAEAASVAIQVQPPLKRLFERTGFGIPVITWGEAEPYWDQQVEIVELPRIFRSTLATLPKHVPYVHVPAPGGQRAPRIGLLWESGAYNPARSIPLRLLAAVCRGRFEFVSFQADPARSELANCGAAIGDWYEPSGCIYEAARRLRDVDLLITVDTMLAHLAGALAVPTWLLLPFASDWRWMLNRTDSPWYATMRLFRQPSPGDWDSVVVSVAGALEELAVSARS